MAETTEPPPQDSWWRKFRRRFPYQPFWIYAIIMPPFLLFGAAQYISLFTWLLPSWRGTALAATARCLWCMGRISIALLYVGILLFVRLMDRWATSCGEQATSFQNVMKAHGPIGWLVYPLAHLSAAGMLIYGRVDLAIYLVYGSAVVNYLSGGIQHHYLTRNLPLILANITILAALPAHSVWLAAGGVALGAIAHPFTKLRFAEKIARKPTQAEYLNQRRKRNVSSGDAALESLLESLTELGNWEEAEKELQHARRLGLKQKRYWQAVIAVGQGRYKDVIQLAESLPREDWKDILEPLTLAYARQGFKETALQVAQEALRQGGKNAERVLADVYAEAGDAASALAWYEHVAQKGRPPDIVCKMATMLMPLGDYREARALFRQAIANTPYVDVANLERLAECCRHLGDLKGAQEAEMLASRT